MVAIHLYVQPETVNTISCAAKAFFTSAHRRCKYTSNYSCASALNEATLDAASNYSCASALNAAALDAASVHTTRGITKLSL